MKETADGIPEDSRTNFVDNFTANTTWKQLLSTKMDEWLKKKDSNQ